MKVAEAINEDAINEVADAINDANLVLSRRYGKRKAIHGRVRVRGTQMGVTECGA